MEPQFDTTLPPLQQTRHERVGGIVFAALNVCVMSEDYGMLEQLM